MKAILVERYCDVRSLEIVEIPDPQPAPGHVLVRVRAAGLGFVDALKIAGTYQTKDPLPFVPGMEVAGTACAANADTSPFAVGDRFGLVARGALGETISVPAEELPSIPDGVAFDRAAGVRARRWRPENCSSTIGRHTAGDVPVAKLDARIYTTA